MLWSKLGITALLQLVIGWLLGLMLIPVFRRAKTGKYEPYIGDRFRTDGSEPSFGGVNSLIVMVFGCVLAAAYCERGAALIAAAGFTAAASAAGILDDYSLDVLGRNVGVKTSVKLGYTFAVCTGWALVAQKAGFSGRAVILPFGIGIRDLGAAWAPVCGAVMTAVISSVRVMNRFGTDDETCIGGLANAVCGAAALGVSAVGTAVRSDTLTALGLTAAAADMTALIWGLSPSKQRSGSSGGFFAGAALAAAIPLGGLFALPVIITAIVPAADAVCAIVQFSHYTRTKGLLLKGSSLHHHMKNKKTGDHAIIAVFTACTLAADALAVFLAVRGYDKFL